MYEVNIANQIMLVVYRKSRNNRQKISTLLTIVFIERFLVFVISTLTEV